MPADPSSSSPADPPLSVGKANLQDESEELEFDSAAAPSYEPTLTRLERRQLFKATPPVPAETPSAPDWNQDEPQEGTSPAAGQPHGVMGRLERKSGDGTKPFTRFVTRPETTVSASHASGRAPSERVIPSLSTDIPAFGKIRDQQEPEYRSSRLQNVMDATYTHSRLGWIDNLGYVKTIAVAAVLTIGTSIIMWPYLKEVLRKRDSWIAPVAAVTFLPSDDVRQSAIRRAFDAYLSAPYLAGKLPWVLDSKRVESRMKDFYELRLEKDPAMISYEVSAPIRAGAEWWFTLDCKARDGNISTVLMKETPSGGELDWENFVAYGSMPWEKFHTSRPTSPQSMRIRLRKSETFSGKYTREDYLAYEISHRSGPPTLLGYAAKSSRSGQLLADDPGLNEWKPVNLYLNWESDAGAPNVVLIGDLIRNNWLDALTNSSNPGLPDAAPPKAEILPSLNP